MDKCIETVKQMIADGHVAQDVAEKYFPELAQSEDERIRKMLIEAVKRDMVVGGTKDKQLAIAWLEKQGKQKPADKAEPKFKICDVITNGKIIGKVDENENNKYHGWFGYDKDLSVHYADIPDIENWHKWTIQDAKDGDVLVTFSGIVFLFQKIMEGGTISFYAALSTSNFSSNTKIHIPNDNEQLGDQDVFPATKEQCNLLFSKMHEAGYEWDADKKELKKIEQKPVQSELEKLWALYRRYRDTGSNYSVSND